MEEFEGEPIDAKFNLNELLGADEQFQSRIKAMVDSFEHLLQPFQLSEQSSIDFQLIDKLNNSIEMLDELKKNTDFNSSMIYLNSLKLLLKNEEFCKSQKWVAYLEEQIELMNYQLDDAIYNPNEAENIKNKYITEDALKAERKDISKRASDERHAENRTSKDFAISYYKNHRDDFKNKDEASIFIGTNIVGYSFSTVRQWLKGV